ncbi:serine protease [Streptomyces sp. NBC_00878]|uniref:serine protease n=1 Tax=Streptomyces sp. NBC_00878 TaxID=2975854 RepID=UPI002258CDF3|nr:serine protease [Streptomyces sp. NBC_00878]MCX4909193.1 serine protease [Streptomyces sp. NBC_00878]
MTRLNAESLVCVETTEKRGSGYLLAPNLVLTAGHCVEPKGTLVDVKRFKRNADGRYDLTDPHTFEVKVHGGNSGNSGNGGNGASGEQEIDFALLVSADEDPFTVGESASSEEVRLGRLVGTDAVPAQALGFPKAQIGSGRMNVEDARGTVRPLTGSRSANDAGVLIERLNFQVESGVPTSRPGPSLWSGMSGSALFSGDHLVGVVVEDRASINGRLHVVPVSRIFGRQGRPDANQCLDRARGLDPATRVQLDPVWAGGDVLRPAYEPMPIRYQWSEADLLRARHDVVPFRGRKEQLGELTDWCERNTERPVHVRLLFGDGAVGKTRLARELCRRMGDRGWIAGIIDPVDLLRFGFSQLLDLAESRLVVVDDADAYAGQLNALLDEAVKDRSGFPLRILAIAHSDGQWWQALRRRYEALLEERDPPLRLTAPKLEGRKAVYDAALKSFTSWYQHKESKQNSDAGRKNGDSPSAQERLDREGDGPDLEEPDFASYLLVLIQALVDARARIGIEESSAVVGGPRPISLRAALLDYAIDVEREAWRKTAGQAGLYSDPVLLERVVAISSLAAADGTEEGAGETEAARRLRLVPDLADEPEWRRRAFARWQHTQLSGEGYLRTLQPLRLADRLGSKVIAAFPDLAMQLLDVEGTGDGTPQEPAAQSRQVLNVLQLLQFTMADDGMAADGPGTEKDGTQPASQPDAEQHKAREALAGALHEHAAALVRLVKRVAVTDQDDSAHAIGTSLAAALNCTLPKESAQEVSAQVLREFDVSCPDALLELATAVAERAVQYHRRAAAGPPTRESRRGLAQALQRWSLYLASSGLRIRAHSVAGQAVDTYHALQQLSPSEEHEFYLAEALKDLADRLVDVGRFEDADNCARDAIRRLEPVFQRNPTRGHSFGLVKALCTLATAAHGTGRQREALQAATEACDLIGQLPEEREGDAEHGPDEIQGMKAFALRGLAWQLGASGRVDQAVAKATESVKAYEALRERCPGLWKRDIAEALSVLGVQHAAREEWDDCVARHSEAVNDYYNALEREYREAVRPQHALALVRLADAYLGRARSRSSEGQHEGQHEGHHEDLREAQDHVEQALDQYDRMRKEDRWANRVHEAWTSRLQAEVLLELGTTDRRAEAAARKALSLYDEMDVRAWKLRFDRARAQAVLAETYGGRGRPRGKVLRAHEQAKDAFARLDAEEPGRAEAAVRKVENAIEDLKQAGPPVRPRAESAANRSGKRRKRHQPKPRLRSRQRTHTRRRHR